MRANVLDYSHVDDRCADVENTRSDKELSLKEFVDIILEVSTLLLESGAHCERINRNVQRIAQKTNYKVEMLISFTAVSVSVTDMDNEENIVTANKKIIHHGVHFGILTNTSLLTWELAEGRISLQELHQRIKRLKDTSRYSVWLVRLFIGIACGSLCLLAGGDLIDGAFAFLASFVGLAVRQEMIKRKFNLMVIVICSAFVTTTISGLNILSGFGYLPQTSIATSVLFLIPGVPLINSIIDLLEGYIPTGIARGAFGGFILLCIAVGMFISMTIIGINNF